VFKLNCDEHGEVIKHKARLVAKGYVQRQGIYFEEVFTSVTRMESVRVILCVAAHFNWTVHHMDVSSAFLNGGLTEEVYVSQPPEFIKRGQESKNLKLHKALYGRQGHGIQDWIQNCTLWAFKSVKHSMGYILESMNSRD
jgi:hypothetical protein